MLLKMSGALGANLHSGFLNEEYGLFLLRQIAAVAPIGRPEDFGIDAVVTLLPEENGFLHAADSFLIQLKSASVKKVEYGAPDKEGNERGHIVGELDWLRSLQIPLFFARVSRIEDGALGRIRIFTSQNLLQPLCLFPEVLRLACCFDESDAVPTSAEAQAETERLKQEAVTQCVNPNEHVAHHLPNFFVRDDRTVWLGDSIVEFSLEELAKSENRENLIEILQTWVRLSYRNLFSAPLGIYRPLKWKTNEVPEFWGGWDNIARPSDAERSGTIFEAAHMPIEALLFERMHNGGAEEVKVLREALEILRAKGVNVTSKEDLNYLEEWTTDTRERE